MTEEKRKFYVWNYCLPDYHVENFITNGIIPFLKKHGYILGFSTQKVIHYCKVWAFNYSVRNEKEFIFWAHDGEDEEYDWYCHTIPIDDWEKLCKTWKEHEFLDDSEAGYRQVVDLHWFIWQCISLESSPQHHKWTIMNNEIDEEDYWIHDENQAYGGDRRTY